MLPVRINKYLASIGIASRRKIDEMVGERRIKIGSKFAKLGDQVDPEKDEIFVDGKKVGERGEEKVYIILNKPKGYVSTSAKFPGEKSVLELIRHPELVSGSENRFRNKFGMTKKPQRLYPIGRLDKDSTGLILLTNDGELAQKLTHPKYHVPKTYEVKILGSISQTQMEMIRKGIKLEEGTTKPADVKIISQSLPHHTVFEIVLYEGKKRQIRRMMAELHLHILELKRISIGPIKLEDLGLGKYRSLSGAEIKDFMTTKAQL